MLTLFFYVLPIFTGFYWVVLSYTGLFGVLLGFTSFDRVSSRFYQVSSDFTGFELG